MSLDVSQAYDVMKKLAEKVGGSEDISYTKAKKILKKADTDGDGIISLSEFKDFYMSTEEYENLEDEYLEAFELLGDLDGEEGFSFDDIDSAIKEAKESEKSKEAESPSAASGVSGGGGSGGGTSSLTSDKSEVSTSNVKSVSLTGNETAEELRTDRSETLSQLSDLEKEKSDIKSNETYKNAEDAYKNSTQDYDDSLDALADIYKEKQEAGEALTEEQENFIALEEARDALTEEKSAQNEVIDGINQQISETETAKADLESQLGSLEPPSESLKVPIYDPETGEQTGVDTSAYDAAMAAYEAQKAELEAQIAEKESELVELEQNLAEAEEKLEEIDNKIFENDKQIYETLESLEQATENVEQVDEAEAEQVKATAASMEQYLTDWQNLLQVENELTTQIDADIDQLRANLKVYDDAIDEKDKEQEELLPDGMHSKNGYIYEGEGEDAKLMLPVSQSEEGANLPSGYEVNEDEGIVVDEDGNTVGKVIEIEQAAQSEDGIPQTVEIICLYADAVSENAPEQETQEEKEEQEEKE